MAVNRKKNGLKPPPASRHRAVLCLQNTIPLFEMQAYSSRNLEEIIWSSRNTKHSLMVRTITNDIRKPVNDPCYMWSFRWVSIHKKTWEIYLIFQRYNMMLSYQQAGPPRCILERLACCCHVIP
jgi:hypothetical protein